MLAGDKTGTKCCFPDEMAQEFHPWEDVDLIAGQKPENGQSMYH